MNPADEEFLKVLQEAFFAEAGEHLQAMTAGIIELEETFDPAVRKQLIERIFREAHSLKGAARAVNRTDIESLCQAQENVFAAWKQKPSQPDAAAFDTLNASVDLASRLLSWADPAQAGQERAEIPAMIVRLGSLATAKASATSAPAAPAAAPVQAAIPPSAAAPAPAPSPPPAEAGPPSPAIPAPVVPATPLPSDLSATAPAAIPERERAKRAFKETIRIPVAKIDSLLLKAEEMLAVKLTAIQHAEAFGEVRAKVEGWHKLWSKMQRELRNVRQDADSQPPAVRRLLEFLDWNHTWMSSLETDVSVLAKTVEHDRRSLGSMVDDLLEDAKCLVMLPFSTILDVFPKMVRDLSRNEAKEVELKTEGREIEIDKRILEEMKDPLIHLVRNAIDHGIESPDSRSQRGKPRRATLSISVLQREDGKVEILVSDDGGGIDTAKVRASAVKNGILTREQASQCDEDEAVALIFQPALSTSAIITEISGRGLGMAIVREKVEQLGGIISIETKPGEGTTFRILLPVTLATFKGILVETQNQVFVIPTASVERVVRVPREEVKTVENRETIAINGQAVALVQLDQVLELPGAGLSTPPSLVQAVVLSSGDTRVAFSVDGVIREQEVLVKPLGKPLLRVRNVAAATVLGSGKPAPILQVADLLKSAAAAGMPRRPPGEAPETPARKRVLVAEDSITARMLLKNILESAGYDVTVAVDGQEALAAVGSNEFAGVVSDVDMPRMNGFALTEKIRAEKKTADLPVILVTARESREDRERGAEVGANAYIVKSSFEQSNLLDIMKRLF